MASTLLSRRLNPTAVFQIPNPFSPSRFLLRSSAFLSNATTVPTSSSVRSFSNSIATVLLPTKTPKRSHLSPSPSFSTAAATSASLPKEARGLSTSPADPKEEPELRHQEITGPTVERDTSALANENRQALESLRRSIHDASLAATVLGATHLALGAWIAYSASSRETAAQALAASAFPLAAAFLMRRTLKPLQFFSKMEDIGRLQILTLSLQSSKNIGTLMLRIRVAAIFCAIGVSAGSLYAIATR